MIKFVIGRGAEPEELIEARRIMAVSQMLGGPVLPNGPSLNAQKAGFIDRLIHVLAVEKAWQLFDQPGMSEREFREKHPASFSLVAKIKEQMKAHGYDHRDYLKRKG